MAGNPSQVTVIQQAIAVLRRFGTNAHVYLPGVGMLNGLQAGNYLDSGLATPATIDNPVGGVVDAIGGINATQPTTASKPILRRGAANLLTYSGDFSNAAWTKASGATISATGITDYLGGTSAVTVAVPSSAGGGLTQVISTWAAGSNGTGFVYAKRASTGSATAVRLTTNNQVAWNTGVSTKLVLTTQWQIIPLSGVLSTTANCKILIGCSDATGAIDGDCIGNVDVCFAGLFAGTYTAQQIQALGGIPLTTTAPASTTLGPQYWSFDGSNDSLALGGPLFQMADDHCVVAGVNCNSATGDKTVFSQRSSTNANPIVGALDVSTGSPRAIWRDDAGTISVLSGTVVGTDVVLTARSSSGLRALRVNSVQKQSASVSLGASTITAAAIGVSPVATPNSYMSGNIYPVIAIKGTVPDADLLLLEKFVANLSGVTL